MEQELTWVDMRVYRVQHTFSYLCRVSLLASPPLSSMISSQFQFRCLNDVLLVYNVGDGSGLRCKCSRCEDRSDRVTCLFRAWGPWVWCESCKVWRHECGSSRRWREQGLLDLLLLFLEACRNDPDVNP